MLEKPLEKTGHTLDTVQSRITCYEFFTEQTNMEANFIWCYIYILLYLYSYIYILYLVLYLYSYCPHCVQRLSVKTVFFPFDFYLRYLIYLKFTMFYLCSPIIDTKYTRNAAQKCSFKVFNIKEIIS